MNIKTKKMTLGLVACLTTLTLLSSCKAFEKEEALKDCSSVFETRYVGSDGKSHSSKKKNAQKQYAAMDDNSKPATECKILEIKLDNNSKCEIVGSDKIDNLSKILSENKGDKIILITPQKNFHDLGQLAQKYLMSNGIDVKKHLDSDLFNNMSFPYKGLRCVIAKKEIVIWSGDKKVILTIGNF